MEAGLHETSGHASKAYEAHRDQVLAVLARRCRWLGPDEREDALHDAYVVMLEKQHRRELDPGSMRSRQLGAYLVRTAIHKALDEGKRAGRRRSEPAGDAMPAVPDPRPGPEEHAEASERRAWARELIAELPERQRTIVGLRYLVECTPAEVRARLGITERTYRRQLERAMATVRREASRGHVIRGAAAQ